jgi:ribosomal-protein-alanine N-acetyltransferase
LPITFHPLTPADAREVCGWRYPGLYDVYSLGPDDLPDLLRPEWRYHTAWEGGALVGLFCAGADAQVPGGLYLEGEPRVLDLGYSLNPALLGQGRGHAFVRAVSDFADERWRPARLRATVAAFNRRSLRILEGLGFQESHRFRRPSDRQRFIQLEKPRDLSNSLSTS